MNKRLAITAQKAIGKGQLLWLDCYNNSIFDEVSPTLKTTTKSSEMNFIMEQGKQDYKQIPQQKYPTMTTDQHLNVITLFSGYDSQALALNRLGLPYDLAAWCEIDRHAITAHNALFPQWKDRNLGDVSKVDWAEWHASHPQPIDLLTYSSPCQDFSNAGLQRGGEEGSGTRSGLLWEVEKAIDALRPKWLVFENVAALVSDKFLPTFNRWQVRLQGYGYTNFCQLMNAKDYGVPQNRQRIFMVSVRDCDRAYYFPKPFKLEKRLKDVLEKDVDERYYLSEERVKGLLLSTEKEKDAGRGFEFAPLTGDEECGRSVTTNAGGRKTDNFIAEPTVIEDFFYDREPRYYTETAPTIRSSHDTLKIAEPQVEVIGDLDPNSRWQNGTRQQNQVVSVGGIAPACTAEHYKHPYKIAEPQMLGWTRNEKGEITDRHPVSVANCVTAGKRDNTQNYVMEPQIASVKSRDKDNPTGVRTANNGNFAQRLEISADQSTSNTLTSVTKDNLLVIPQATYGGRAIEPYDCIYYNQADDYQRPPLKNIGRTIKADSHQPAVAIPELHGIRIRRLTERELYRLMDVEEHDIDTLLASDIARTQHSKLAGNSIVVACLYYIFKNLFTDTVEPGTQIKLF